MALKSYNLSSPHQKTLIGNWSEERHWASTATENDTTSSGKAAGHSTRSITTHHDRPFDAQTISQSTYVRPSSSPDRTVHRRDVLKQREMRRIALESTAANVRPVADFETTYKRTIGSENEEKGRTSMRTLASTSDEMTYVTDEPVTIWTQRTLSDPTARCVLPRPHGVSAATGASLFGKNSRFSQPITEFVAFDHQHMRLDERDPQLVQTQMHQSRAAQMLASYRVNTAPGVSGPITTQSLPPSIHSRDDRLADILGRLLQALMQRGEGGIHQLGRMFKLLDVGATGFITEEVFVTALRKLSLPLSDNDVHYMYASFDRTGAKVIRYDAVLYSLRGSLNSQRAAAVDEAFQKLDAGKNGFITAGAIVNAFHPESNARVEADLLSREQAIEGLLADLDVNTSSDIVSAATFVHYYENTSPFYATDSDFVASVRKAWA